MFNGKLATVWSAPNYCYRFNNLASILELDEQLNERFNIFEDAPENKKNDLKEDKPRGSTNSLNDSTSSGSGRKIRPGENPFEEFFL